MKKESILYVCAGLLAGIVLMGFTASYAVNNQHNGMMRMMGMHSRKTATDHGSMSMSEMSEQLETRTGEDFDRAFLEMMIAHHEGAIEMAKLIPDRASHQQLKIMGEAIIDAQTKEVKEMKQWQKDWGYSADEMMNMMHGNR